MEITREQQILFLLARSAELRARNAQILKAIMTRKSCEEVSQQFEMSVSNVRVILNRMMKVVFMVAVDKGIANPFSRFLYPHLYRKHYREHVFVSKHLKPDDLYRQSTFVLKLLKHIQRIEAGVDVPPMRRTRIPRVKVKQRTAPPCNVHGESKPEVGAQL